MSDENTEFWALDEDIQEVLEEARDRDSKWVDFALKKSRRIGEAVRSCEALSDGEELGARLFLMTCLSDYYFLCRHYGIVDKPFEFAGEVPVGDRWFRYTECQESGTGMMADEPLVEVEGQDRPDDGVPRAAMIIEDLGPDEEPQLNGFLLPQRSGRADFAEVLRTFWEGHEEGFRCDRVAASLVLSWGFEDLSELLSQPNVRMWDVNFGGGRDELLN